MSLKLGLIGCSNVAKKNLFSYLENNSNYDLWIIGSRSSKNASEWANNYGAKHFGNYDDVINSDVDVVYISLPIGLHEEWCVKAAKKGINIICEKSLTTSLSSTKNILDECKKNKVRLLEAFSFRFHPQHKKFKELTSKHSKKVFNFYGSYGMPPFPKNDIRWNKDLGGGILNDVACYPICASRIFFESEPEYVYSHMEIDADHYVDVKVDIMAKFPQGEVAYLSGGFNHYYQSKYSVWTDNMKLELTRAYAVPPTFKTKITLDKDDQISDFEIDKIDQFGLMFNSFHDVLKGKAKIFNFESDIIEQARFMEAVRTSHKEKRLVKVSDIR